jgi:hypothetical protein
MACLTGTALSLSTHLLRGFLFFQQIRAAEPANPPDEVRPSVRFSRRQAEIARRFYFLDEQAYPALVVLTLFGVLMVPASQAQSSIMLTAETLCLFYPTQTSLAEEDLWQKAIRDGKQLREQGRYREAESLFQRALTIVKKVLVRTAFSPRARTRGGRIKSVLPTLTAPFLQRLSNTSIRFTRPGFGSK